MPDQSDTIKRMVSETHRRGYRRILALQNGTAQANLYGKRRALVMREAFVNQFLSNFGFAATFCQKYPSPNLENATDVARGQ